MDVPTSKAMIIASTTLLRGCERTIHQNAHQKESLPFNESPQPSGASHIPGKYWVNLLGLGGTKFAKAVISGISWGRRSSWESLCFLKNFKGSSSTSSGFFCHHTTPTHHRGSEWPSSHCRAGSQRKPPEVPRRHHISALRVRLLKQTN